MNLLNLIKAEYKMNNHPSIKRNAILNIIRTLFSIVFPLITFPYATRILLPDGIGKTQFASGIISYFVMVAGLGIGTYGIRETAKNRDDSQSLTKVTKELFVLSLIPTVIAYILFGIALFVVPKFYEYRTLLIIYSATILFATLGVEWLYSGLEQYKYITIRQFAFQIFSLVAVFLFVRQKEDTLKYAAISVLANVGANACNFVHSGKYIQWFLPVKLNITKHLKPVFVLFGTRIAASLYVALDTTLLGFLCGDAQVGYYEAANKMTRVVVGLITSVTAVLLPRLSYYIEKRENSAFHNLLEQSFDVLILFALPLTVGLFLLSENIILIISGVQFLPAVSTMCMLSPLVLIIPLSGFLGNQIFLPLGKERISLYAMLTGAVVNIVLSVVFIKRFGAFGAAFASVLAETSITVFYFIIACRQKLFSCKLKTFGHCVIATIIMAAAVYFVNKFELNLFIKTSLSTVCGIVVYAFVLAILRNPTYLDLYNQIRNKIFSK